MTKDQKLYAQDYFKNYPEQKVLHMNPQGEWFTDKNYAVNSLPKNKDGEREGKIETVYPEKNKAKDQKEQDSDSADTTNKSI